MNCLYCCVDLCDKENKYGCCHQDSCLFNCWFGPFVLLSCPIWGSIFVGDLVSDSISKNVNGCCEFSRNKRSDYTERGDYTEV
ncbi:MAG TPA: hypothetical protein VLG50_07145 [Candidatus Saccharimonadales bacterium]|nr:hypothetical protein [Candidatus Saccharimonadales bacterium]